MGRAQGARAQLAAVFETIYGTAPATGFRRLPFATNKLSSAQPLIDNELLGYGRDPLAPQQDVVTVDGAIEVPIDVESFGVWLKAAFGAPTTNEPTLGEFHHVFESGKYSLPSLSIETGTPEVPRYAMATGVMLDKLGWSMGRSGQLRATCDLIAQGEASTTTSSAGTPTDYDIRRFGHFQGAIKRDGAALANVVSAEISYANNLDRVEVIRSDGRIEGLDPSMAVLSGSITARFASTTLRDQARDGNPCALQIAYSRGPAESLTIDIPAVYLPVPRVEIDGPGGIQATYAWQAAQVDGAPMCTVTLINAIGSY